MGTKVHCKSYFPGYYSMRDLNEDANSSWPLYYEDMTLSGQLYNGFTPRSVNGYSEYDKEILRQTMLKHETIFRKQVYELHRLYRIQRDLMDELKREEQCNYSVQAQASQSSPFLTQMLPKDTEKVCQMPHLPVMNVSCSRTPISGIDDMWSSLNFLKGSSLPSGLTSTENGGSPKGSEMLDSKIRKFPRRMLDLQLPADAYIDNDDTEQTAEGRVHKPLFGSKDPINRNCGFETENDVKLTLGTTENPSHREESWKSNSHLQNGPHVHSLADLNEPLEELCCEEVAVSSTRFPGQTTHHEELQGHQKPMKSNSSFLGLQKDFFQDRHKGQAWSHVNSFNSSFYSKNLPTSSGPVLVKPKKPQEFSSIFSPKQNKTESWFREKSTHSVELSERGSHLSNTNYSDLTVPTMPGSLDVLPHSDYANTASSLVSSWRKLTNSISHIPISGQALPCFSGSAQVNVQSRSSSTSSQNPGNTCDKWQYNGDIKSRPSFGNETSSYPNGYHHGFRSDSNASSHVHLPSISFDKTNLNNSNNFAYEKTEAHGPQKYLKGLRCKDVKSARDMNLNLALPNGFRDGFATQQNTVLSDAERKKESLLEGMSWLRTKSPCNKYLNINKGNPQTELGFRQGYSQLMSNCGVAAREIDGGKETEDNLSLDILQDSPSILEAKGTKIQRNEASDTSSSKRILCCSSILDKTERNDISSPSILQQEFAPTDVAKNRVKEGFLHTSSSSHTKLLDVEKQIHMDVVLEKGVSSSVDGFRDRINLNSTATSMDQPKSLEISSKDEIEDASQLPVQSVVATIFASEIDLETPIISQAEEPIPSAESSLRIDHLVSAVRPQSKTEGPQATESLHEMCAGVAAEIITAISLDACSRSENIMCLPSTPVSVNSLRWFADVVSCNADDLENVLGASMREGDGDQGSSDVDGMDFFEHMTLKLRETKVDEYWCRPLEQENPNEEETGVAHLLLTRPRRGQARRRRQRRDFQKDILPGLASLSRHEVTEDLQTIGGLMRASGRSWQMGVARRNTGRNCQARGRRRPRGAAAAVVEIPVDPLPRQLGNTKVEIDGRSIMVWGRTTRRCRRQRCLSGNIFSPPQT